MHEGMIFVLGLFQTIFIAGWLAISAMQRRFAGVGSTAYAFFGVLIALWAIGELLILAAEGPLELTHARRVFYLGAAGLPPTWFWVAVRAASPEWYGCRPQRIAAAFVVPAFFYSCLYWDESGRFVDWTAMPPSTGSWFDVYTIYQYALSLAGCLYFMRAASHIGRSNSTIVASIAAGVALPIGVNFLYYFRFVETDWTAVALGPAAVLLWLAALYSGVASRLPTERGDLVTQLDVGVIVADPDGRIVSANPAAIELAEVGDLHGMLLPEAVAAAEQRPDKVIESRGIVLRGQFGITGHALILTDRTEAESSRRRLEIGGRLEALGSLTAGIAHEVNNPLAFIQANLSALESTAKSLSEREVREGLPPALREEVEDMGALLEETQEGVERIRDLVQRLKTFARTPDLSATAVEVDLDRVVRQAGSIATIGQKAEPIRVEGHSGLRVISIETAVFQILVNLLINAVQACPERPVVVSLAGEADGVAIRVDDDGPGIAEALLPRIFDPFFTTKAAGTGLGLSLSHDLARQLGGHLYAANREGGGARFVLWLPSVPPVTEPTDDSAVA